MRKFVLLLMCLVLVLATPVVLAGSFEAVGGVTFNTVDIEQKCEDGEIYGIKNQFNGNGLYAGGRYWFSDKMAAGLGYDYVKLQPNFYRENDYMTDEDGTKMDLKGFYGELVYKMTDYVKVKGALANYNFSAKYYDEGTGMSSEYYDESEEYTGSGMGYLIGAEMFYPVTDSLTLTSELSYRTVSINMDDFIYFIGPRYEPTIESTDLKGLRLSVGLNYAF